MEDRKFVVDFCNAGSFVRIFFFGFLDYFSSVFVVSYNFLFYYCNPLTCVLAEVLFKVPFIISV